MVKILLVDDDPLLVRMYQKKFEIDGYQVSALFDGERVQTEALFFKPDLILLDIMMPKVNGLEVLKKIRWWMSTACFRELFATWIILIWRTEILM